LARSSTTIKPGEKRALKHGRFSAEATLKRQNEAMAEAKQRLQSNKLKPLELHVYKTLLQVTRRRKQLTAWLNKHHPGDDSYREFLQAETQLLRVEGPQGVALWKMLFAQAPFLEDVAASDAQEYFNRYTLAAHASAPGSEPSSTVFLPPPIL
jgi:hypothetical protein